MEDVQVRITETGVGIITLTREKALHSLSSCMIHFIYEALKTWETHSEVHLIILESTGTKAFCAGGDIKELYHNGQSPEGIEKSKAFLHEEYEMDQYISTYPKPIVALMDGIVMGGGVGLSYGASYRIVTENTKWAMPETGISFFPDIGAGYFLNQAPGHVGMYLGLTGKVIQAADVLYINAADAFMTSTSLLTLKEELLSINWSKEENINQQIKRRIEHLIQAPEKSELEKLSPFIHKHFTHDTLAKIVQSLQVDTSELAGELTSLFKERSPVSLSVTFAHLQSRQQSFSDALEQDKFVAAQFMECADFFEGVRCRLIERGTTPSFRYKSLEEVPAEYIHSFIKK